MNGSPEKPVCLHKPDKSGSKRSSIKTHRFPGNLLIVYPPGIPRLHMELVVNEVM